MRTPLVIKLPPEGTLIRDFVLASLNYLKERGSHVTLERLGDEVKISAPTRVLEAALRSLYEESAKLAENKAERIRLGVLRNDKGILSKLLNVTKDKITGTYLDVAAEFLKKSSDDIELSALNKLERHSRGIRLGNGGLAALNFLTAEKYECGLEFGRLNIRLEFKIELDKTWYQLVLAGFVWCISTQLDEDILFSYLPEDFIWSEQINIEMFNVIKKVFGNLSALQKSLNDTLHEVRSVGEPFSPTILLLSLRLSKAAKDSGSLDALKTSINSLPISQCRLRRMPRTFVIIDKRRVELCRVLKFASDLAMKDDESVRELEEICRRNIQLASGRFRPRKNEPDFTVYNRFTTLLLQAIEQAYSVYEVVYYGSRYGLLSKTLGENIIDVLSASPLS